jgi:hypothetical protein
VGTRRAVNAGPTWKARRAARTGTGFIPSINTMTKKSMTVPPAPYLGSLIVAQNRIYAKTGCTAIHPQLFGQVLEHWDIGPRCDAAYRQGKGCQNPAACLKDVSAAQEPSPLIGDLPQARYGQPALAKGLDSDTMVMADARVDGLCSPAETSGQDGLRCAQPTLRSGDHEHICDHREHRQQHGA